MNTLRKIGTVAVLAIATTATLAVTTWAATFALQSSPEIPAAEGTARLRNTKNGNIELQMRVKHLAQPSRISPGAEVFVVWVRGLEPGAEAQNLGALQVDKRLNGKLTAVTAMSSFDLFITCETSQTVTAPTTGPLLPLHYLKS
jgi:hypothetical protein